VRALLDTHVFLWWISDSTKLSALARETIADESNEPIFSVVSGWEITIKVGVGKLELPDTPEKFVTEQLYRNDVEVLPMYLGHALRVHALPDHHRDPFDRLLVAQAIVEGIPLLTADPRLSQYAVETIW
jgi:PIN domain nuclease of toxin-antitoxin system